MIMNLVAARTPRMMPIIHMWVRVQQTKIYEAVSDAVPSMI